MNTIFINVLWENTIIFFLPPWTRPKAHPAFFVTVSPYYLYYLNTFTLMSQINNFFLSLTVDQTGLGLFQTFLRSVRVPGPTKRCTQWPPLSPGSSYRNTQGLCDSTSPYLHVSFFVQSLTGDWKTLGLFQTFLRSLHFHFVFIFKLLRIFYRPSNS